MVDMEDELKKVFGRDVDLVEKESIFKKRELHPT